MNLAEDRTESLIVEGAGVGRVAMLRIGRREVSLAEGERWTVGTSPRCDIRLDDAYVSGHHCTVERRADGVLVVRDEGSRNGTRIDGNLIVVAEMRAGSYLSVGRTTLVAHAAPGNGPPRRAIELLRGSDPVLRATIDTAMRAGPTGCNVLVAGETGTGKDLIARLVHETSRRNDRPFVAVNCGAIPRDLIASELFGHERGAFTGAHADRDGYFVEADGGTLFLDELGELPIEVQPTLLRVLESRRVRRVGGQAERAVDVRIVTATNRIDGLGTESSRLRTDLYHRVATVVLTMPPLRDRMADLPELVRSMLDEFAYEYGDKTVSGEGWEVLGAYHWPGNVRELRQAVARAVALGGDELLARDFFPDRVPGSRTSGLAAPDGKLEPYQEILRSAMEHALNTHGSIRAAAAHLGMAKSTFADKAKEWGLAPRRKPRWPKR
jgi:DNA-binding NtrC family response regulator|nr:sigma 54-interacting transcriptional regulator [Kofleriaceae bacterium]